MKEEVVEMEGLGGEREIPYGDGRVVIVHRHTHVNILY